MTYNTKAEFMAALKSQAEKYSLSFGEMAEDCYLTSRIRIFDTQNTKSE
mgnify:CR=1 FL=1